METQITTTARRIQKYLAETPAEVRVFFDSEGNFLEANSRDLHYIYAADRPSDIDFTGGRYTQRHVQDRLDALATDNPAVYLDDLHARREMAAQL